MIIDSFPDRLISIKGEEFLYFGGTSYLGMATQSEFQMILSNNINKWGTSYGSSRNSNVKLSIYEKFENQFSVDVGAQDSAAVSSGMLAGKFVMEYLSKTNTAFYHYPKTHPAVIGPNSSPLFIDGTINEKILSENSEEIVICVDTILSLEVTPTDFDFLNLISSNKNITLVVDESHSLGIVGENGGGIFQNIPMENLKRKIMVSSLGKALGLSVGIICGDRLFIDSIKNETNFISASATNPACLATYLQAKSRYKKQRSKLKINLEFISSYLKANKKYKFDKKYPVIYSNDETIFSSLLRDNIIITRFKYPTYKNYMNRIVITANHKKADLEKLINLLNK
jgi:7-keto-8-aminopelargonate synthetase-like enzyme